MPRSACQQSPQGSAYLTIPIGGSRAGLGLAQQLIGELLIDQRTAGRRLAIGMARHLRSVLHHVSFREPHCLRLTVRSRHLHSR